MTPKQEAALRLAREALQYVYEGANNQGPHTGISWRCASNKIEPVIAAIDEVLSDNALDKMAENARELGLDYEPAQKDYKAFYDGKKWYSVEVEPPCKTGSQCTSKCQQCDEPHEQPHCDDCGGFDPECPLAQPAQQQEPVEWGVDWGKAGDQSCVSIIKRLPGGGIEVLATEYGPPASKPWVGLTDEDLAGCDDEELKQARYWEAKLREKNA